MKAAIAALLLLSMSAPVVGQGRAIPAPVRAHGSVQIAFAPWDDTEAMIVAAVNGARRQILVQAYSFTSRTIANALIDARRRGVDVRMTADREQTMSGESSRVSDLVAAGIPVLLEVRYASAHNKVMVIDAGLANQAVVTGSFNWTWSAQNRNAENVIILRRNAEAARAYTANWWRHAAEALPYEAVYVEGAAPGDARQRVREPVRMQ